MFSRLINYSKLCYKLISEVISGLTKFNRYVGENNVPGVISNYVHFA